MKKLILITLMFLFCAFIFAEPDCLYKKEYNTIKNISETIKLEEGGLIKGYFLTTTTNNNITNIEVKFVILSKDKEKMYGLLFELETLNKTEETYSHYLEKITKTNKSFKLNKTDYDLESGYVVYHYNYY